NTWSGEYFIYNTAGEKFKKNSNEINEHGNLNYSGTVTKNGKPVEDVEITIEKNELPYYSTKSPATGNFSFKLELQNVYVISFNKKGFNRASILINTYTDAITDTVTYNLKDWKVSMTDNF